MKRNMFVGINRKLLIISGILALLISAIACKWVVDFLELKDETDLIDVDGIIWYKRTSMYSPSYFYIVDPDILFFGPTGWQYNTSFHVNHVRPGEDVSPDLVPSGIKYASGGHFKDYEQGDYFTGQLEIWHGGEPGVDMGPIVGYAFLLAISMTIIGWTYTWLKYDNFEIFNYEGDKQNG